MLHTAGADAHSKVVWSQEPDKQFTTGYLLLLFHLSFCLFIYLSVCMERQNCLIVLTRRYLLERVLVITLGIVTLKYHDLILYAMVNTHLGIKDHISGPNQKMVCVNYQALASLKLKSVELTWPAQWKTVATAAIFAARDFF